MKPPLTDAIIFHLNNNISSLQNAGIIGITVTKIEKKSGNIEDGKLSEDVIKDAIERTRYEAKKNVIKALIIAGYKDKWEVVYY